MNWSHFNLVSFLGFFLGKFFSAVGERKFEITDTKMYVSMVTLWTQDNAKLHGPLKKPDFKRTINWNKCQSKVSTER